MQLEFAGSQITSAERESLETFWFDLRFAFRSLARDRKVAIVAVFMLALGIGSSTVAFSVFYHLLIDPFPYKDSKRLVRFGIRNLTNKGSAVGRDFFSRDEFAEIRAENHVFEDMVGYERLSSVLYRDASGARALPGMA